MFTKVPDIRGGRTSLWRLIRQKKIPPTRKFRYCCAILKEQGGAGNFYVTGVRHAESTKRKERGAFERQHKDKEKRIILMNDNDIERRMFENCKTKAKRVCNPIIDWTDREVWEYLRDKKIPVNPLYAEGFCRVGCIGCPMAGKHRYAEFGRWPKFKTLYLLAFEKMIEERRKAGLTSRMNWNTPEEVFRWWMEDRNLDGQTSLFDWRLEEELREM